MANLKDCAINVHSKNFMNNWLIQFQVFINQCVANLPFALGMIGILWGVFFINKALRNRLLLFGIYPRTVWGLLGILFSPFLHGDFKHLLFNSIPLFILTEILLVNGHPFFYKVSILIILISGLATWLFGRKAIHIGASSLIMGYWSFVLFSAYLHPSIVTIISAVLCIYYLWSLIANIFPSDAKVSWEGHVFGFLAGIITVYLMQMRFLL